MLSFWETQSFITYDIVIIGSGIVGISAAISIKEKYPTKSVLVLERGIFPAGASTRNAGFTTFGGVGELLNDLKTMSPENVFNLVKKRWDGLQMLRQRLGDEAIDYRNYGGCELIFNNEAVELKDINFINDFLEPLFNTEVFSLNNSLISTFGFNKNFIKHCIYTAFEGQLDTGKMMRSLLNLCMKLKIVIQAISASLTLL